MQQQWAKDKTKALFLEQIKKIGINDKGIVRVEVSLTDSELKSVNKTVIDKYLMSNGASNVNGISESKKINLIKKDNTNTIDTKMDVVSAIKAYAKSQVEDSSRDGFIELAMDIYKTYKSEAKD